MQSYPPSGSPGLDRLLKAAFMLSEQPDLFASLEFDRHVEELQAFRRGLEKTFKESLRLSPRTQLLQSLEKQFESEFERFREGGQKLESYVLERRLGDLEAGCSSVHTAILTLQRLAGELRAQEESWKQQYGEGLGGEIKFLLDQTMQRNIPYQQAAQALEKSLEACRAMENALAKTRPESDAVEDSLEHLGEELASFIRALERAVQSLRKQHEWEIEERLEDLLAGADTLVQVHRQLLGALYPPVLCPKCGLQQMPERPTCSACSARLPMPVLQGSVAPPPSTGEARPRFGSFVEIETRVKQALQSHLAGDALMQSIEVFMNRLRAGRKQMADDANLPAPLKKQMTDAAETTEKALLNLRSDLRREDWSAVEDSFEVLLEAEQLMLAARDEAERQPAHSTPNS